MTPLLVLIVVTVALAAVGGRWWPALRSRPVALRGGLAAMFVTTGLAHFVGMRDELISMVPPALPAPDLLVTVTGVLELAGAAGLLWTRTAPWAAAGLGALLVVMFPANVYAAAEGFGTPLVLRAAMQVVFLVAILIVWGAHLRERAVGATAGRRAT